MTRLLIPNPLDIHNIITVVIGKLFSGKAAEAAAAEAAEAPAAAENGDVLDEDDCAADGDAAKKKKKKKKKGKGTEGTEGTEGANEDDKEGALEF